MIEDGEMGMIEKILGIIEQLLEYNNLRTELKMKESEE